VIESGKVISQVSMVAAFSGAVKKFLGKDGSARSPRKKLARTPMITDARNIILQHVCNHHCHCSVAWFHISPPRAHQISA